MPPVTPTRCVQRLRLAVAHADTSVMASLSRVRPALPPLRIECSHSMQGEAKRYRRMLQFEAATELMRGSALLMVARTR